MPLDSLVQYASLVYSAGSVPPANVLALAGTEYPVGQRPSQILPVAVATFSSPALIPPNLRQVALLPFAAGASPPANLLRVGTPPPSSSSLLVGLISDWRMNEASGTRADSNGTNNLTSTNAVSSTPGGFGNVAVFAAASSQSLDVASNSTLQLGGTDFTWAGWAYLADKAARYMLVTKGDNAIDEFTLEYNLVADRFIANISANGSSYTPVTASTFGSPTAATWYFIRVWYDSVGHTVNISVNDGATDSVGDGGVFPTSNTGALHFGTYHTSLYLNGREYGWNLWKRTLTAAEGTRLYGAGAGLDYPFN